MSGGASATAVLLIPESSNDSVGSYDPQTGAYLGDWLGPNQAGDAWSFSTPIEAIEGPNGNIYVSDQVEDAVLEFMPDGTYVGLFADTNDGLNNVRGIAFLGTDLLVSNSQEDAINRFDAAGNKLADFVSDANLDPFDVLLTTTGDILVTNIGTPDEVREYPLANPASFNQLTTISFPQQISETSTGNYLVAGFSSGQVIEITPQGTVVRSVTVSNPRGVRELGNGNWLITASSSTIGVSVFDPTNDTVVMQIQSGSGYRYISPANVQ